MTHVQKETAVLLKEKGFSLPSKRYYNIKHALDAPIVYQASNWLRNDKNIHIYCMQQFGKWCYFIQKVGVAERGLVVVSEFDFDTHDLALEAGIVHALKNYVK